MPQATNIGFEAKIIIPPSGKKEKILQIADIHVVKRESNKISNNEN